MASKKQLTEKQRTDEINLLKNMPDEDIDYSDIPPVADFAGWHSRNFKPRKQSINIRIDRDVLEWLKTHESYTSFINAICREKMNDELKSA